MENYVINEQGYQIGIFNNNMEMYEEYNFPIAYKADKFNKDTALWFLKLKPSEIIRVAVEDIQAIRRSNRIKIDMTTWVSISNISEQERNKNLACTACMAGAALIGTFGLDPVETAKRSMGFENVVIDCNMEPGLEDTINYLHKQRYINSSQSARLGAILEALDNLRCGYPIYLVAACHNAVHQLSFETIPKSVYRKMLKTAIHYKGFLDLFKDNFNYYEIDPNTLSDQKLIAFLEKHGTQEDFRDWLGEGYVSYEQDAKKFFDWCHMTANFLEDCGL